MPLTQTQTTTNTRIRNAEFRLILSIADQHRLDIVDVYSALIHRWNNSSQRQRLEAIDQLPPKPRKGRGVEKTAA